MQELHSAKGAVDFLAKFTSSGDHVWSKRLDYYLGMGKSVAVDGSGNVFVTGDFNGGGSPWLFLDKYGPDGSPRWARRFGTASSSSTALVSGSSVAVTRNGDPVLVGEFKASISVGGAVLTNSNPGYQDVFVAKYSGNDGTNLWSKRFGSSYPDYANGVSLDSNDNITITGRLGGSADFGGGLLPMATGMHGYLASLTTDGSHRWSRSFGLYIGDAKSVAVGALGNLFATGSFTTLSGYGGNPVSCSSGGIFVLQFAQ